LGGRDIENQVVTFVRRDTGEKGTIDVGDVGDGVKLLFGMISSSLMEKAKASQASKVQEINSLDNIPEGKILKFGWCGGEECGHKFEDAHDLKILGYPYGTKESYKGKCIICGKETNKPTLAARTM
jgi:prolyl-tRNA synthetase